MQRQGLEENVSFRMRQKRWEVEKKLNSTRVGVGLRPPHFPFLEERPRTRLQFFEAVSENYMDTQGRPLEILELIREDYPVALHGVGMNLGRSERIDPKYLQALSHLVKIIDPFIVSDHLCWTGTASTNFHDLLPFPFTEKAAQIFIQNIQEAQEFLGRRILIENVSTYLQFRSSEMTEWEFLNLVLKKTDCRLLLDINNLYVNSINHGFDAREFLKHLSIDHVGQIHLAGYEDQGDFLFDTHSRPVTEPVWDLFSWASMRLSPELPILVEWDADIPDFSRLEAEATQAKALWEQDNG